MASRRVRQQGYTRRASRALEDGRVARRRLARCKTHTRTHTAIGWQVQVAGLERGRRQGRRRRLQRPARAFLAATAHARTCAVVCFCGGAFDSPCRLLQLAARWPHSECHRASFSKETRCHARPGAPRVESLLPEGKASEAKRRQRRRRTGRRAETAYVPKRMPKRSAAMTRQATGRRAQGKGESPLRRVSPRACLRRRDTRAAAFRKTFAGLQI